MDWIVNHFGERRRSVRAFARRAGVDHSTYKAWEDRGSTPTMARLEEAFGALAFPDSEAWAAWLITGHGTPPLGPAKIREEKAPMVGMSSPGGRISKIVDALEALAMSAAAQALVRELRSELSQPSPAVGVSSGEYLLYEIRLLGPAVNEAA